MVIMRICLSSSSNEIGRMEYKILTRVIAPYIIFGVIQFACILSSQSSHVRKVDENIVELYYQYNVQVLRVLVGLGTEVKTSEKASVVRTTDFFFFLKAGEQKIKQHSPKFKSTSPHSYLHDKKVIVFCTYKSNLPLNVQTEQTARSSEKRIARTKNKQTEKPSS